jgi:integrase
VTKPRVRVRYRHDRKLWEVDYRDADGHRRRPLFPTEEAAHEHATEVLRSQGVLPPPAEDRDITLRAYATRWLAIVEHEKDPNTVRGYRERLEGHVLPALGHLKIREIQRGHIKAFLAHKRGRGYAKNSVRLMRAALSVMLSDAVDDGIIVANQALQLGRRKASRADKLTSAERLQNVRPMTWEQRDAFLGAAASERPYSALFVFLVKAGLRPSEAFALKPDDIDWRTRTVRVERAWNLGREKPTKTYEGRTVDLTPDVVQALERHLRWVKEEALRSGLGEPEWLFPNDEGHPHDESRVRKAFKRALKAAKLPAFRLYDLRHTFASLLLAAGAPITYVSAQLGHANPATTLRYYARWIPNPGRRWVDLLDRVTDAVASAAEISGAIWNQIWNQAGLKSRTGHSGDSEVPVSIGGPSRTRTLDPLIKSQLPWLRQRVLDHLRAGIPALSTA